MNREDNRREMKEFLVMVCLGVPGLALLLGGIKMFQVSGGLTVPGAALAALGGSLVLATGYFHYRKDYAAGGKRGLMRFLALTAVSALTAMLATGTLFRLLGR